MTIQENMVINFICMLKFWKSYNIIDSEKHVVGKAHTHTVEHTNRFLRHYLAHFTRKTYSVLKSQEMITVSL